MAKRSARRALLEFLSPRFVFSSDGLAPLGPTSQEYLAEVAMVGDLDVSPAETFQAKTAVSVSNGKVLVNDVPTRLMFYGVYGMVHESDFAMEDFFKKVTADRKDADGVLHEGVNAVRIFLNFHWANSLAPFKKVKIGDTTKYDLGEFESRFFGRLSNFVKKADEYGVVVQLCLFDGVMLEDETNRWTWSPYRESNNNNKVLKDSDHIPAFFRGKSVIWRDSHQPLIEHTVKKLSNYSNILWEVMNEPTKLDGFSNSASKNTLLVNFHKNVIRELEKQFDAQKAASRLIAVNVAADDNDVNDSDALFNFAKTSPKVDLVSIHVGAGNESQAGLLFGFDKPVIISNDGHQSCNDNLTGSHPFDSSKRAVQVDELMETTFGTNDAKDLGKRHFEFLDQGMYGDTHGNGNKKDHPDYDPKADSLDEGVLDVLAKWQVAKAPPKGPLQLESLAINAVTANSASLSWAATPDATGYRIELGRDGNWWHIADTTDTAWMLNGLSARTAYDVRVTPFQGGEPGLSSGLLLTTRGLPPNAPSDLRTENRFSEAIDLRLNHDGQFVDSFYIESSTDGTNWTPHVNFSSVGASVRVHPLSPATRYWFRARATNQEGDSEASNVIETTTRDVIPAGPSDLRLANVWTTQLDLNWDDRSHNESGFVIQISTNGVDWTFARRVEANRLGARITGLASNKNYWFRIAAENEEGLSDWSNTLSVRTKR